MQSKGKHSVPPLHLQTTTITGSATTASSAEGTEGERGSWQWEKHQGTPSARAGRQRSGSSFASPPILPHDPCCQELIFRPLNWNSQKRRETTTSEWCSEVDFQTGFGFFVCFLISSPHLKSQPPEGIHCKPSKRAGSFRALCDQNPSSDPAEVHDLGEVTSPLKIQFVVGKMGILISVIRKSVKLQ